MVIAATLTLALLAAYVSYSSRFRKLAFTFWVSAFGLAAVSFPDVFISWGPFKLRALIVPLIQVIMFGMGTTLSFEDFRRVSQMPKAVLTGCALQFTIMPLVGAALASLFRLPAEVATGLILVGSCPGGVSSNVITYLARGNVALSVTMTASSTILSPLITPLAMKLLAGHYMKVAGWSMALSILQMIVVPVFAGLIVTRFAPGVATKLSGWLPPVSMLSICIIIAITIALSRDDLLVVGVSLFAASVCHNGVGFLLGYFGARVLALNETDSRTVAIEVGLQNGGMATGLAFNVLKSHMAALASAVFGPWAAFSSSILASYWRSNPPHEDRSLTATSSSPERLS